MSSELKVLVGEHVYSVQATEGKSTEITVKGSLPDGWQVLTLGVQDGVPGVRVPMGVGKVTVVSPNKEMARLTLYHQVPEGQESAEKIRPDTMHGQGVEVVFTMQRENAKARGRN